MAFGVVVALALATLTAIALAHAQLRRRYAFRSALGPHHVIARIGRSSGAAYLDDAGDVTVPMRHGVLSVTVVPGPEGTVLKVWLSGQRVKAAGALLAVEYRRAALRIRRAVAT